MKFFKSKIFLLICLVILLSAGGLFFIFSKKPTVEYTTAVVTRGRLIQTVSETGMVKSINEINLNFPGGGKIAKLYVAVGDKVIKDQVMAELDNSDLLLKTREAQANLDVARANLAKLIAGATSAELAVKQAGVDQAKTAYDSAVNELEKTRNKVNEAIRQAEKNLSDLSITSGVTITSYQRDVQNYKATALTTMSTKIAVADNALDNINTILSDDEAENYLGAKNVSLIELSKASLNLALPAVTTAQAGLTLTAANQTNENIIKSLTDVSGALDKTFTALNNCYSLLEASVTGSGFTQAELDAYKTTISTQQGYVSTGITAVQTAQHNFNDSISDLNNAILTYTNALATAKVTGAQEITSAEARANNTFSAWQLALAQLNELKAGTRIQDINLAQAQVGQAQAALDLINNQISNNIIKSPVDGTVTKKNYEVGEQASSAKPVFSVLGTNNFEIEIDVSEADINKVALNNFAEITLDAFGEDLKFSGYVSFIEPAETIIQDVIYYKVKINFDGQGKNVKSGMTANANITTASKDNVLIIPSRAIIEKNGNGKFVRLLVNGQVKEVPVTIGLRGDESQVEVLAGIGEGDKVITYIKQSK